MILDLDDYKPVKKSVDLKNKSEDSNPSVPPSAPYSQPYNSSPQGQIVHKVIMTRQEISIYPNGQVFPGKITMWVQGFTPPPKKVKKQVELKQEKVQEKEEY